MPHPPALVDSRRSWIVTTAALGIMMMAFGAAWITSVALKDIAAEVAGVRSVPALASALLWFCSGVGGILMSWLADRIGVRWTVLVGTVAIAAGLAISTLGLPWPLWLGHAVLIGLVGIGAINAPLYVYASHWFAKRRGSALALISSGNYLAGAVWPSVFEPIISAVGWRQTMLIYAVVQIIVIVPLALIFLGPSPEVGGGPAKAGGGHGAGKVLGLRPNTAFGLLCIASVLCCLTMSMPQQHLVALCSDLGFTRTFGAGLLAVLLGAAVFSRQVWGAVSDRIGGLFTILITSTWQLSATAAFLLTQSEAGLIAVSAFFGLGFAGIVPAYVLTLRDLFPAREAYWRVPTLLLFTAFGMGGGGWVAGVIYDHFGYYAPAFGAGILFNAVNLAIVAFLALWGGFDKRRKKLPAEPAIMPGAPA